MKAVDQSDQQKTLQTSAGVRTRDGLKGSLFRDLQVGPADVGHVSASTHWSQIIRFLKGAGHWTKRIRAEV